MSGTSLRTGGAFGLAGIALLFAGMAVIRPSDATLSASPDDIVEWYTTVDGGQVLAGGYLQVLGLLCFLPFLACLVRLLRRGEGPDAFGASTALLGGAVYTAASLTPGMAGGATALWIAQHSPDDATVYALNHLRSFSYQISLLAWAVFFAGVAASALAFRTLPRWLGVSAGAIAVALAIGVARAVEHWHDLASVFGVAWVVAASIWMLRARTVPVAAERSEVAVPVP